MGLVEWVETHVQQSGIGISVLGEMLMMQPVANVSTDSMSPEQIADVLLATVADYDKKTDEIEDRRLWRLYRFDAGSKPYWTRSVKEDPR